MRQRLSRGLFNFVDKFARKLHPGVIRLFSMPINYQLKSIDNVIYESARMVDNSIAYCWNNKIQGDYAEFGAFQGRTTVEAWRAAQRYGLSNMRFRIFDSFAGLPEISGQDIDGPFVEGEFACTRPDFEKNLRYFGVDMSRVEIVEGFFDKTLVDLAPDSTKIAVAFIDCDLYESTVPVLDYLTDRLVNGAVLIFDDWFCFDGGERKGEQLACSEWLQKNPHIRLIDYHKFHWGGNSFIVNRV